jgi:hypothetical protein
VWLGRGSERFGGTCGMLVLRVTAAEQQRTLVDAEPSSRCYRLLPTASVTVTNLSAPTAGVAAHAVSHSSHGLSVIGALTEPSIAWQPIAHMLCIPALQESNAGPGAPPNIYLQIGAG